MTATPPDDRERGFAVIELVLAATLTILIAFVGLAVLQNYVRIVADRSTAASGSATVATTLERMRDDAASAYAVYVPLHDVFGRPNAATPADVGHEVDFFTRDDVGRQSFWGYAYDGATQTVRRYDFDADGRVGVADRITGRIDTTARYAPISGVRAFETRTLEANDLTDVASARSAYAGVVSRLLAATGATPKPEPVGFVPDDGPKSDLYGGNTTVQVRLASDRVDRTLHLASATSPSGFVVKLHPGFRFIVYRLNTIHRSWFGLVQKTRAEIDAQVLYNYSNEDTPDRWKVWCDYKIYGAHINGIDLRDRALVAYRPNDYSETADGIYNAVTSGVAAGNDPSYGCGKTVPGIRSTPAPAPSATSPDVVETPPPCFARGTCWPPQAPADWAPPSPWPVSPPPAPWCATHALSPVCAPPPQADVRPRSRRFEPA